MNVSPANIASLRDNEVFVFGSNTQGWHGKGAALLAKTAFGAVPYRGMGPTGHCYAIATKEPMRDNWPKLHALPLDNIAVQVKRFLRYAKERPEITFLVTEIGCGLAGYTPAEIAPMFRGVPDNVHLPASFCAILNQHTNPTPASPATAGRQPERGAER